MNLLNVSLVSIVEVLTKFRFCDAAHDREDSADLMNLARHDLGFSKTMDRFPKGKRSGRCARARQSVLAAMTKPQAELKRFLAQRSYGSFGHLAIFTTGVLAFECARNSLTSVLVYSRRTIFFLADSGKGIP